MHSTKTKIVCPLGMSDCVEVKGSEIQRCAWLVGIEGKHPQSEEIVNEERCAMAWVPVLLVENAQTNRGQTQAIEAVRNIFSGVFHNAQAAAIEKDVQLEKQISDDDA